MNQKKQLSILEFSRLTGISRDNLRFYDRIGLLCPEQRGENNYRYYARSQLNSAYLISSLRLLEVGLEDIRRYSAGRTPERMLAFFAQQEERIQAEIPACRTSEIMKLRASWPGAQPRGRRSAGGAPRNALFVSPRRRPQRRGERNLLRYAAGRRPQPPAGSAPHPVEAGAGLDRRPRGPLEAGWAVRRRLWTKHSRRFRAGLGRTPRLSGEPEPAPHRQRLRRAAAGRALRPGYGGLFRTVGGPGDG
ncbi:MAG: MerR family DNA-binding transcriptional regulator [Flavonifractor plautii]